MRPVHNDLMKVLRRLVRRMRPCENWRCSRIRLEPDSAANAKRIVSCEHYRRINGFAGRGGGTRERADVTSTARRQERSPFDFSGMRRRIGAFLRQTAQAPLWLAPITCLVFGTLALMI